jgi:hypothetical protein
LSKRARDAEAGRARDAWKDANAKISEAVHDFRERAPTVAPGVQSGVRAVERAAEQVGGRLRA